MQLGLAMPIYVPCLLKPKLGPTAIASLWFWGTKRCVGGIFLQRTRWFSTLGGWWHRRFPPMSQEQTWQAAIIFTWFYCEHWLSVVDFSLEMVGALYGSIHAPLHLCTFASMHLCIHAPLHPCTFASMSMPLRIYYAPMLYLTEGTLPIQNSENQLSRSLSQSWIWLDRPHGKGILGHAICPCAAQNCKTGRLYYSCTMHLLCI